MAKGIKVCPHCEATIKGCRTISCPECGKNTIEEKPAEKKYKYIFPGEWKIPPGMTRTIYAIAGRPSIEMLKWNGTDEELINWAFRYRQHELDIRNCWLLNEALDYAARHFIPDVTPEQIKRCIRTLPDVIKKEVIENVEDSVSGQLGRNHAQVAVTTWESDEDWESW